MQPQRCSIRAIIRIINRQKQLTCFHTGCRSCPCSLPLLFSHSCRDRLVTSFLGNNRTVPALGRLSLRTRSQSPTLTFLPQHPSLPEYTQLHPLPIFFSYGISLVATTERPAAGKGSLFAPCVRRHSAFALLSLYYNIRSQHRRTFCLHM